MSNNNSKNKEKAEKSAVVPPEMVEEQQDVTVVEKQEETALVKPAEKDIVEGGFVMTSSEQEEACDVLKKDLERLGSVGAIFQYYRELRGLSINEVSCQIRMRMTSVSDIEHDLLNQETAVNFTRPLIERYAKFLNIDAATMAEMYCTQVKETVRITRLKSAPQQKSGERYKNRNIFLLILILAIAGFGYYHFSQKEDQARNAQANEPSVVTGSLGEDGQELQQQDFSTPMVTGSLTQEGEEQTAASESVVIEDKANAQAAPVVVVDANTARAQAQAQALHQQNHQAVPEEAPAAKALPLKGGVSQQAQNISVEAGDPFAAQRASQQQTHRDISAQQRQQAEREAQAVAREQKQQEAEQARAAARAQAQAEAKAKAEKEQRAQKVPELKAHLKDISSKVKVINPEGLASLNNVSVTVLDDVYLSIVQGNGSSSFKGVALKGKKIQITGIPPFVVAVTDTSAVKISYKGGEVRVPKSKQVKFELPIR